MYIHTCICIIMRKMSSYFSYTVHSFIHSLIPPFTHSFIHSFTHSSIPIPSPNRSVSLKFGPRIGRLTLFLLLGSCGMYIAAPAFLPSSFCMCFSMLALGAWFRGEYEVSMDVSHCSYYTLSWHCELLILLIHGYTACATLNFSRGFWYNTLPCLFMFESTKLLVVWTSVVEWYKPRCP